MQKQKQALALLCVMTLAICLTSLIAIPTRAYYPPETFGQTYTQHGGLNVGTDFYPCYVQGTLFVTYTLYRHGPPDISYSSASFSYSEVGTFNLGTLQTSMYRDGQGETLHVSELFEYVLTTQMTLKCTIHAFIHYSELTGLFTCWGYFENDYSYG